jgi:hypothetical protein
MPKDDFVPSAIARKLKAPAGEVTLSDKLVKGGTEFFFDFNDGGPVFDELAVVVP